LASSADIFCAVVSSVSRTSQAMTYTDVHLVLLVRIHGCGVEVGSAAMQATFDGRQVVARGTGVLCLSFNLVVAWELGHSQVCLKAGCRWRGRLPQAGTRQGTGWMGA
jgi:hypothetical protein